MKRAGVVTAVGEGVEPLRGRRSCGQFLRQHVRPLPLLSDRASATVRAIAAGSVHLAGRYACALATPRANRPQRVLRLRRHGRIRDRTRRQPGQDRCQQMPLDRAALIGCGVMTGVGAAVNTARVEAGSVAVVFGCGGVGLNAIQGCAIAGAAMIVAVDTSEPTLGIGKDLRRHPRVQRHRSGERRQGLVQVDRQRRGLCLRLRWQGPNLRTRLGGTAARWDGGDRGCRRGRRIRSR